MGCPCLADALTRVRHAGAVSEEPGNFEDAAQAALAQARIDAEAARVSGSSYGIALALTQAGHALLTLGQPTEGLADFNESLRFIDLLRADGQHEQMRLLSVASLSLAPPDQQLGDLDTLEAWARVGRAGAIAALGDPVAALAAIAEARPWVRGWRRRHLRKALDMVSDHVARESGTIKDALGAATRAAVDTNLAPDQRKKAQYERLHLLAESGENVDAVRAALQLLQEYDTDRAFCAHVRQVLGAALAGLGQEADATTTLQEAFEGFVVTHDEVAIVAAAPGLASRLSETGNDSAAIDVLTHGLAGAKSLRRAGDTQVTPAVEIDLLTSLATAFDGADETAAAIDTFARAIALADESHDVIRGADARHGEAIVRIRIGGTDDSIEALSLLDSARSAYGTAQLSSRVAGCNHEAGALLAHMKSVTAATTRYQAAIQDYLVLQGLPTAEGTDGAGGLVDSLGDAQRNLVLLQQLNEGLITEVPADAFDSGGHRMHFAAPQ